MLYPSTQYKLCILQGLIVEQPVQLRPLCRGVANAESVVKAILAGASAVEVCSAVYLNTNAFIGEANRFLSAWMERKGFENIAQFKGKLNIKDIKGVNTFERTQFLKYFGKKE